MNTNKKKRIFDVKNMDFNKKKNTKKRQSCFVNS